MQNTVAHNLDAYVKAHRGGASGGFSSVSMRRMPMEASSSPCHDPGVSSSSGAGVPDEDDRGGDGVERGAEEDRRRIAARRRREEGRASRPESIGTWQIAVDKPMSSGKARALNSCWMIIAGSVITLPTERPNNAQAGKITKASSEPLITRSATTLRRQRQCADQAPVQTVDHEAQADPADDGGDGDDRNGKTGRSSANARFEHGDEVDEEAHLGEQGQGERRGDRPEREAAQRARPRPYLIGLPLARPVMRGAAV